MYNNRDELIYYHQNRDMFSSHYDKWVAIQKKCILGADKSREQLIRKLNAHKIDPKSYAIVLVS